MKKILILALVIIGLSCYGQDKSIKFSIKGEIAGLEQGDTLRFSRVELPGFDKQPAFDVVVKHNDKFSYKGNQNHPSEYYSMTYHPKIGETPEISKSSLSILISSDKYTIKGDKESIYMSSINGGDYDNTLYKEMANLDDSIEISRSKILIKLRDKTLSKEQSQRYSNEFNNFQEENADAYKRLSLLKKRFFEEESNSELLVIDMLKRATFTDFEYLNNNYNHLSYRVKNSRYGKLLENQIDKISKLNIGNVAPMFTLQNDSTTISLSDMKGKHVLIYNWGLCPGSMSIDSRVLKLHQEHKDKICVIGVTEFRKDVVNLIPSIDKGSSVMGMNLYSVLNGFLAHPYPDFEIQKQKENISDIYMFGGLPYFVLIDPDGKILSRGFFETFDLAEKLFISNDNDSKK